jgi:aquaporin Z
MCGSEQLLTHFVIRLSAYHQQRLKLAARVMRLDVSSKGNADSDATTALDAIVHHWPEYLIEAAGLGIFMVVAGMACTILEYPSSPIHQAIGNPVVRRALMGIAMGATAMSLTYSPFGKRSGAHFNPALTLAFLYAGKVKGWDALFYIVAQFIGGLLGVLFVHAACGNAFALAPVSFVVTVPGTSGVAIAFTCELAISFLLMSTVLYASNRARWRAYTGALCGLLIATYVTLEAPFSGMSMNPARTVASALPSGIWTAAWIYFIAPVAGMLFAVHAYRMASDNKHIACAKLAPAGHTDHADCIFICSYRDPSSMVHASTPASSPARLP